MAKYYDLNSVCLVGRLAADPVMRETRDGKSVADLRVAVANGDDDATVWVDVTAWDKTADAVGRYCQKGSRVGITGRLTLDTWQDKETGQSRTKLRVTANTVQFLTERPRDDDDRGRDERPSKHKEEPARGRAGGHPLKDYGLDDETPF